MFVVFFGCRCSGGAGGDQDDDQLVHAQSAVVRILDAIARELGRVTAYQGDAISMLPQSALYSFSRLVIHPRRRAPGRLRAAMTEFRGRRAPADGHPVVMSEPNATWRARGSWRSNAVQLIGSMCRSSCRYAFYPFGVFTWPIILQTALPRDLLEPRASTEAGVGAFRSVALPLAAPIVELVRVLQLRGNLDQLIPEPTCC